MNPKLEQIARALCRAAGINPDSQLGLLNSDKAWWRYVESARATVEAMREPTGEMVKAGANLPYYTSEINVDEEAVYDIFKAMIDEVLK